MDTLSRTLDAPAHLTSNLLTHAEGCVGDTSSISVANCEMAYISMLLQRLESSQLRSDINDGAPGSMYDEPGLLRISLMA